MSDPARWQVQEWLDPGAEAIEYSAYWDDPDTERGKPWDVVGRQDLAGMESYLEEVGLRGDLRQCLAHLGHPLRGEGIDLAAGTLWAARDLVGAGDVERLYCLEYSRHRLMTIGPFVLERHGVDPGRVVLVYGSFYDLRIPDGSLDFAFMSQALHHADRPEALLAELHRALGPEGVVIVIGEHRLSPRLYALYAAKSMLWALPDAISRRVPAQPLARRPRLRPEGSDLEPADPVLGDHFYTQREYRGMFEASGFQAERLRRPESPYQSFVLRPRP